MRIPLFRPLTALALGAAFALPAYADEAPEGDDSRAKLRAQIEKVLKLMGENEQALLEASTQGGKAPKGPEIPLPEIPPGGAQGQPPSPPPQGSGGAGAEGSGAGGSGAGGAGQGSAGSEGEKARAAIEELLKGAGQGAGKIPVELEELIKMLPT